MWVVAHECGHRAFSDNTKLQDAVGYLFHTLLLVPYWSWQRSHAVHHARANHMSEGETHVPYAVSDNAEDFHAIGDAKLAKRKRYFAKGLLGKLQFGGNRLWSHLVFGWPAYIIGGATGGPLRGNTSHFDPTKGTQGRNALFPGKFAEKVRSARQPGLADNVARRCCCRAMVAARASKGFRLARTLLLHLRPPASR